MSTEKLIELVKENRLLFDLKHPDYKNVEKKEGIWSEIAEALCKDVETVKRKWKNLRDSYGKYLRSMRTRPGKNAKRYQNWHWAPYMEKLLPFANSSNTTEVGVKSEADDAQSTDSDPEIIFTNIKSEILQEPEESEPQPSTSSRKRPAPWDYFVDASDDDQIERKEAPAHDGTELIFLGYARTVKSFSLERQARAKYEIAKIIFQHELDHAREQTQWFISENQLLETPEHTEHVCL